MPVRSRNLLSMLLGQLPTVLTLALLAVIAAWGYVWDWKIPTLGKILHPPPAEESKQAEKKDDKKGTDAKDQPLPLIKLESDEVRKAAGIETAVVEERIVDEIVMAHGHLDFDQNKYAHLSTRAGGRVWDVYNQTGDMVKKGRVLALIAAPEVAQLKFELQQTLLAIQTRKQYYNRLQMGGTTTAPKDLELALSSLREARIQLSKDQQSLQNLGLMVQTDPLLRLTDEEVNDRLRTLGIPDTLLQEFNARELPNSLLPTFAPFNSMVIKRDVVKGEMVTPATPQFVLADLSKLWIMMHVRLEDVSKLKPNSEVIFHLDGVNEDAPPATISWISSEVDDKTRTVTVRADVPNPNGHLRPNTLGDARIRIDRKPRLIVPNGALQFDSGQHFVFVQGASPTAFQPTRVKLVPNREGHTVHLEGIESWLSPPWLPRRWQETHTVVVEGLEAGQTIAVSGTRELLTEMLKDRLGSDD